MGNERRGADGADPGAGAGRIFWGGRWSWPLAGSGFGRQYDVLGVMAVGLLMSAFYFDLSWDGQWYHQWGIYLIADDWNPLMGPMQDFTPQLHTSVRHFPKGPWYVAAAIYEATGNFEAGKCPAVLSWAVMGLAVFAASLDWGLKRRAAVAIALVVALNPVVMSGTDDVPGGWHSWWRF